MDIVIAGAGKVGSALSEQLCTDHRVTVIDKDKKLVKDIINVFDVMGICGDASDYQIQTEANVGSADLLIATTDNDEKNILACLIARKLGVSKTIARVRDPEHEDLLRFMSKELGLSMAINPEKAAASEIDRMLRFPDDVTPEAFCGGKLELARYAIPENSPLHGLKLMQLSSDTRAKVLVCAVLRDGRTEIPSSDFALQTGDVIYLSAAPDQLRKFFRYLGIIGTKAPYVMIAGAGKISFYLVRKLLRSGAAVTVIDPDEKKCLAVSEAFPDVTAVVGEGEDLNLLIEEGLGQADAFVSLTDSDEANILICMSVSDRYPDCRVAAKINRRSTAEMIARTGFISHIVSTSTVTSQNIVQYVKAMQNTCGEKVKTLYRLADSTVNALEFNLTEEMAFLGKPLREIPFRQGNLIAGIVRKNGEVLTPSGNDCLLAGDDVIVVTLSDSCSTISDLFR